MTLKPGAIRYQEKYWHIIHQMKSLKKNWIISIKQLKCSIYYCNLQNFTFIQNINYVIIKEKNKGHEINNGKIQRLYKKS